MAPVYILIGVLVGWIIEWIVDWLYWRGQVFELAAQLEDCRRSLLEEQERSRQFQLEISKLEEESVAMHTRLRELEAKLDKAHNEREAALQELSALKAQVGKAESERHDDLKKIEGIGPKIESLLNQANIYSFSVLARTPVEKLRQILKNAGSRFRLADPTTWPRQAQMAAEDRWEELSEYQDALHGGREG